MGQPGTCRRGRPWRIMLLFSLLAMFSYLVDAQMYIQTTVTNNGMESWRPTAGAPLTPVLSTSRPYILQYNRYFLNNIFDNANNWIQGTGNGRRDFHYDFFETRKNRRRDVESCPPGWLSPGGVPKCPQPGQQKAFRYIKATHTGDFWPDITLQQGSDRKLLYGLDANGQRTVDSRVRWSCDEFPPAIAIQGGTGAETRCAGFFCGGGISAEQQYQARVHSRLRRALIADIIQMRGNGPNAATEVVKFGWDDFYNTNGPPARVVRIDPAPGGGSNFVYDDQPFEKRSPLNESKPWSEWTHEEQNIFFNTLNMTDLYARGMVTEFNVLHNETTSDLHEMDRRTFDGELFGQQWQSEFDDYVSDQEQSFKDQDEDRQAVPNAGTVTLQNATQLQERTAEAAAPMLEKRVTLASVYGKTKKLPKLLAGATESELQKAIKVVEKAIEESTRLNNARYDHVARNRYQLRPGTIVGGNSGSRRRSRKGLTGLLSRDDTSAPPQLFDVTPDIAAAAALVAEADAAGLTDHGEVKKVVAKTAAATSKAKRADPFWMEGLTRKGTVPWGTDSTYKVFRNVKKDYGAVGDGVADDTAAIVKAMTDGNRCGENCNGSTLKNAIVYFPAGTYLVSKAIEMPFGTQVIGDANSRPTIVASSRFIGLGVLSTDKYTGGGLGADGLDQEYYINTANFYRQIRNIIIDVTATRPTQGAAGLHYQVAQATSTQNVDVIAKTGTSQRGMFAENGSGGHISDMNFKGGNFCIYGGNQQFTANRLTFDGCTTAVQTIWDWGWVWKQVTVKNTNVGFQLVPEAGTANKTSTGKNSQGFIGSASFIDSTFSNVGTAIVVNPLSSVPGSGSTGLVLENVGFTSTPKIVADTAGKTLLTGGTTRIESWASGPIYAPNRTYSMGATAPKYRRLATLLDGSQPNGIYYERPRPQYEGRAASDFIHVKDLGAKGDGVTDDSAALNSIFKNNVGALIFVDAGTYILKDTVYVPPGSVIVGEAWSQFAASGTKFSDPMNPVAMLRVGNGGEVGSVELQDLIFTTQGPTAGAVLVEWNLKASQQGAAALWDCHARVGGATGTKLTSKECPAVTSGTNSGCQGASMLFHLTKSGSGYFENMWLWVADHDIDDPALDDPNNDMKQCSVYVSRGFLIESTAPTWLYGTASEHSVMYQYNFNGAASVYAGMLQTETPYYQPTPKPPEPFKNTVGVFKGDPNYGSCGANDFDGCDSSWAVMIRLSQDIYVSGAGTYSFFSTYTQNCIDTQTCQKALILVENNKANIRLQHIITIGAKYMVVQDGKGILASDNLNVKNHPAWSQISIFDLTGNQEVHISPNGATIIPLSHTTVPRSATLTLDGGVASDIPKLPNDGNQNAPPGPGKASCGYCSFFRLLSSTCCGSGGSLGNPIVIPANQPIPVPIELPAGFVPNQDFKGNTGRSYANGIPLDVPVTIPAGTTFPVPFTIPANMPLGDGEDQSPDGSGGIVWIDPSVWNMTSPTIFCNNFPCTVQFPPWRSATSTITYPIVTITDKTYSFTTTYTRSPITITQWAFSPYTITSTSRPTPTGSKSTTDGIIWFIYPPPSFASTKTWPPITYTPSPGVTKTTAVDPTKTPHPPPPAGCCPPPPPPPGGKWPSMTISVSFGSPKPTVKPCGFPAFGCPVDPDHPDDPGEGDPDPGNKPTNPDDPDNESDDDGEPPCNPSITDDPGSPVSTQKPPTTTAPAGPKYKSPDPQNNKVDCYESGQRVSNDQMRLAAESFCKYTLGDFNYYGGDERFFRQEKKVPNEGETRVDLSLEVYQGCQWKYNVDDCVRYLSVPINSCNCNGVNGKQGGFVGNSCIRWRIDPNYGR